MSSISYPPSHRYDCSSFKRSKSSQYPSSVSNFSPFHHPPIVHSFELDFNSEVDDLRGLVYGTGGALLRTISRVVRQLSELHRLHLVDLFLVSDDARQLVCEISDVSVNYNLNYFSRALKFSELICKRSISWSKNFVLSAINITLYCFVGL